MIGSGRELRRATTWVVVVTIGTLVGGCAGAVRTGEPSRSPAGASLSSSADPAASPSADSNTVLLGAADIDRILPPGSYRIDAPFDAPFSIAFPTEWTLKSLSGGDVSFLNTEVNDGNGAAWITIDRIDTVYDDPCHGGPIRRLSPRPSMGLWPP